LVGSNLVADAGCPANLAILVGDLLIWCSTVASTRSGCCPLQCHGHVRLHRKELEAINDALEDNEEDLQSGTGGETHRRLYGTLKLRHQGGWCEMRSNNVVLMTVVGHRVALGLVLNAMADRLGWGAVT
jgi:hypothetical protein